jgi:anti-sigma factor RsiW
MNNRPITEEDLHAYVDRALEPERQAEVAAYLDNHPDVAKRIGAFSDQRDLLRAALAPIAEEPLPSRLTLSRIIDSRRRRRSPAWLAAAAVVLLSIGSLGGWLVRGEMQVPPTGMAALAQEAAYTYDVYASDHVRPVELRSPDTAQLVQWVSERFHQPVKTPDLKASGYRLMGGRLVATPNGAAAMFMYDNDHGSRLVVFMRPMRTDRSVPMRPQTAGDVAGFSWIDKGMGYSLVGKAETEKLRPIAYEVRRQADLI